MLLLVLGVFMTDQPAKISMPVDAQRPWLVPLLCVVLAVMTIGAGEGFTGYEVSFFVFYFIPVAWTVRHINPQAAYWISVLCVIVWLFVDRYSGHVYTQKWIEWWNAGIRLAAFFVVAYLVARLQKRLVNAKQEIKILSGLLPICVSCKQIRDDNGYWHQIESYIATHSDAKFTHGLCKKCYEKQLMESGLDPDDFASPPR
jgi:uncharacterized membrane protein YfcA